MRRELWTGDTHCPRCFGWNAERNPDARGTANEERIGVLISWLIAIAIATTPHPAHPRHLQATSQVRPLRHAIAWNRQRTWAYQDRAGVTRTRTVYAERRTWSVPFLRWEDRLWNARRIAARRLAARHPALHLALWLCIHRGEGDWNANTGNGYYGGLQMTYGWDGLVTNAALLSPAAQMAAAETGYRQSGYSTAWLASQWPHTSPPCLGFT